MWKIPSAISQLSSIKLHDVQALFTRKGLYGWALWLQGRWNQTIPCLKLARCLNKIEDGNNCQPVEKLWCEKEEFEIG